MDKIVLVLLRVQERCPGLKSSVEHNTSQEFELFTSESEWGSDSVIQGPLYRSVVFVVCQKFVSWSRYIG